MCQHGVSEISAVSSEQASTGFIQVLERVAARTYQLLFIGIAASWAGTAYGEAARPKYYC
jgi:hypothetical protein